MYNSCCVNVDADLMRHILFFGVYTKLGSIRKITFEYFVSVQSKDIFE